MDEHFLPLFYIWGWKKVLNIFTRSMLLFSCEGFQHFGHNVLKKSLLALALQGLLSAAFLGLWRWDWNGSAPLPFGCLFPVTFEVCRHQFQEETRGLIYTGDVCWNSCSLDGVSRGSLIVKSHILKPGGRSTWLYLTKNQPEYSVTTSHEHSSSEHVFTQAYLRL